MSRGSEWRKWDLHVHTPASIVHNYGAGDEVWESFLLDLESLPSEFSVIGVNDYLFVDGYERLLKEKESGRLSNIDLLLPVVELRLDKFAGTDNYLRRANIHIVFDSLSPDLIRAQFLTGLSRHFQIAPPYKKLEQEWEAVPTVESLTELGHLIIESVPEAEKKKFSSPLKEGFNNLNVSIESVRETLKNHYFRGKHLIAIGKAEWASIKWNDHSIADKKDLINSSDCVFVASASPEAYEIARKKLVEENVNSKLLDCSDAHTFSKSEDKDRIGNCYTWIKADPTFRGLRLALLEFDKRVFVGDVPDKLQHVANHPTRYIRSVSITPRDEEARSRGWFDFQLDLNPGLTSVIGNKGSGKSALLDTIGLMANSGNEAYFSFLNKDKFRHPRKNLSDYFNGELIWESGEKIEKSLSDSVHANVSERVRYLPQHYIEILCNEIKGVGAGKFNAELGHIVFGHVDESDRLGFETIEELIDYRTETDREELNRLRGELASTNSRIVELEKSLSDDEQARLRSEESRLKAELAAVDTNKPEPVDEPKEDDQAGKDLREQLDAVLADINAISEQREQLESERGVLTRQVAVADRIEAKLSSLKTTVRQVSQEINSELSELGWNIDLDSLIRFDADAGAIKEERLKVTKRITEIESTVNGTGPSSLSTRQQELSSKAAELRAQLNEPQRRFVAYQQNLRAWENRRKEIQGAKDAPGTLSWVTAKQEEMQQLPELVEGVQEERRTKCKEIYSHIAGIADVYRDLYRPIEEFLEDFNAESPGLPVSFSVDIVELGMESGLWQHINRQVRGTFSGKKESEARLRDLIKAHDFNVEGDAIAFAEEIHDCLHQDRREGVIETDIRPESQLRQGGELDELYNYLFGLTYLRPEYSLRFGEKGLDLLSPGERGLLLLIFYLLVDSSDLPLVVDQPEENLDNQTIYETLVRALAKAVKRRQVIVATHSANVAVVCDSEQIVHAAREHVSDVVTYSTGSLENPPTNATVIDVLEGTRPAFDNRSEKYVP